MATAAYSSSSIPNRPTYSCIRCADRKVKCDRQKPCGACVKRNVECNFNSPQAPRKRHKRVKVQALADRLRQYEALLQEQGVDLGKLPDTLERQRSNHTVDDVPGESHVLTPSSTGSEPSRCINSPQVVHGQGRSQLVENPLWSRVVEEFHDPEDALEYSSNDTSDLEASEDDFDFVLTIPPRSNIRSRHPPPERIHQLWQIFTENVDPVTKIVHVPTVRSAIQKAVSDLGAVPRSLEALMFAIYGAAVMSMGDDDCQRLFGEARKPLLLQYVSATKVALSRAKFMSTISLAVLQALVLHLLSVRDIYEQRAVWSLTGVAIRIAQCMGLDRDGEALGLPPFETEMRRRVWTLLKAHDYRTAELCGLAKFRDLDMGTERTKWPTNVNDDQLYPGMPSLPSVAVESNTLTDMVFITMRRELTDFAMVNIARYRRQGVDPSQWTLNMSGEDRIKTDEAFKAVEEVLETKYLRYCDPSQPLHLLTMLMARFSINIIRFLTHHPRRWASIEETPASERQWIWEVSTKLLEQHIMWQSMKQFAWHAAYYQQWHAFIHVLDTLRASPLIADAEKAWQLIGKIYGNTPAMIFDTRKSIHVAVGNLCLKAYNDREAALQSVNMCPSPTPEFISQLRQQREVAKAKRQARDAKSSQLKHSSSTGQSRARDMGARPDIGALNLNDDLGSTYSQQNSASLLSNPPQNGYTTEDDPFWFTRGFDDNQVGNVDDVMDMDLDFMLAQDQSVEGNASQSVNWEQWDAWLADSSLIRPLS